MKKKKLKIGILITTTNDKIKRVEKELLPQLKSADEIIISHQIFDNKTKPSKNLSKGKIRYFYTYSKGLSKNRNNALKNSKADISKLHACTYEMIAKILCAALMHMCA